MAEVLLDRVSKQYVRRGPFAVRDLNLHVRDGEFVVLVGPSGCGKTTTLRLIVGLEQATSGDIFIGGRNVNRVPPRDRNIAMVFQDYALYPHMTAQQNLAFPLRMRKTLRREIEQRVQKAAEMLGISDLLQLRPGALSGGQRQRVALGRAIVRVPDAQCFLFDEPLSHLDVHMRVAMRTEIKELHRRLRMTTIYVTHDQEEAMTLGERVVVMAEGMLQQEGPPLEVYRQPRNRFVGQFIGSPAMNMIDGRLLGENGSITFVENGSGGLGLNLDGDRLGSARRSAGAEVVLGVRPEHLSIERETVSGSRDASMEATVRFTEVLGDQMNVHATTVAGSPIIARMKAREAISEGDMLRLTVDPAHVHLFAPGKFGENLLCVP